MLQRYAIVLVAFPFTDGPAAKPRPALVITTSERYGPPGRDELDLSTEHPDFAATGLKVTSRLRLSRMTTLAMPLVKRHEVLQRVINGQD